MNDSTKRDEDTLRHLGAQIGKHDHRLCALEEHYQSLKLKCLLVVERQANHGTEMEALRELMNLMIGKVQDNTTLVSQTRDELMGRLTALLMWIIGGLLFGALTVGASILSWWLDKL